MEEVLCNCTRWTGFYQTNTPASKTIKGSASLKVLHKGVIQKQHTRPAAYKAMLPRVTVSDSVDHHHKDVRHGHHHHQKYTTAPP